MNIIICNYSSIFFCCILEIDLFKTVVVFYYFIPNCIDPTIFFFFIRKSNKQETIVLIPVDRIQCCPWFFVKTDFELASPDNWTYVRWWFSPKLENPCIEFSNWKFHRLIAFILIMYIFACTDIIYYLYKYISSISSLSSLLNFNYNIIFLLYLLRD